MIYYLSLGSNLGERELTIQRAMHYIEQQIGPIQRRSSFYYSQPWGFQSEHPFCNLCCSVKTEKEPMDVLITAQLIERALGRTEKSIDGVYSDRIIDIDLILAFDDEGHEVSVYEPELKIPHQLWQQRDFVRIPLNEILNN